MIEFAAHNGGIAGAEGGQKRSKPLTAGRGEGLLR